MLLALKTGGYAIFTSRTEYLTSYRYAEYMQKLVDEGKWEFTKKETYIKYNNLTEKIGRFSATES